MTPTDEPDGPVANGTATGYATGDEMFKAEATQGKATAALHQALVHKAQWQEAAADEAEERRDDKPDAEAKDPDRGD